MAFITFYNVINGYTVERSGDVSEDEHATRVLAGYKAALHSQSMSLIIQGYLLTTRIADPRVSDAAKKHAREYLKEHGAM